ncbi:EAL domain-containing protein [Vibrio splendidus]
MNNPTRAYLKECITMGEFQPYYQPYFESNSSVIKGVELLARWIVSDTLVLTSKEFIHHIEKHDLTAQLSLSLLSQALPTLKKLEENVVPFSVSINISTSQLRDVTFTESFLGLLAHHNFPAHKMILELSDGRELYDNPLIYNAIINLKDSNIVFAIDSFDLSNTSINKLSSHLFNELKIDLSSINDLSNPVMVNGFMQTLVSVATNMEFAITAKGIESLNHASIAKSLKCHYQQGYLLARPMDECIFDYIIEKSKGYK